MRCPICLRDVRADGLRMRRQVWKRGQSPCVHRLPCTAHSDVDERGGDQGDEDERPKAITAPPKRHGCSTR